MVFKGVSLYISFGPKNKANTPLFFNKTVPLSSELKNYYDSDVEGVPFSSDPRTAWETINKFVEEKTLGIVTNFMKRYVQEILKIW